jgi:DNA-binding MarR family transcriptional regulator
MMPIMADLDAMGIPGLLRAARTAYGNAVRDAFAAGGFDDIPRNGAYVLARTHDNPSPLSALTRELGISKQAVSQLIDTMVMRGYLERKEDSEDRRRMLITLTRRGEAAARASWEAATAVDDELARRLTSDGVRALRDALKVLVEMGWADDSASVPRQENEVTADQDRPSHGHS